LINEEDPSEKPKKDKNLLLKLGMSKKILLRALDE